MVGAAGDKTAVVPGAESNCASAAAAAAAAAAAEGGGGVVVVVGGEGRRVQDWRHCDGAVLEEEEEEGVLARPPSAGDDGDDGHVRLPQSVDVPSPRAASGWTCLSGSELPVATASAVP